MRKGIHKNERTYCSRNSAFSDMRIHVFDDSIWEMEAEGLDI